MLDNLFIAGKRLYSKTLFQEKEDCRIARDAMIAKEDILLAKFDEAVCIFEYWWHF
jgi:hypothetical protein